MKMRIALCFLLAAVAVGCSESSESHVQNVIPGQQIAVVGGDYTGNYSATATATTDFHATIDQNGINLTGSYTGHGGVISGTLTGAVGTNSFTATFTQTRPCPGSFNVTGTVSDKTLTATLSGSDCNGNQTGSFTVSRP